MNFDDYRFETLQGIKLKLPPVSNVTVNGLEIPILRHPPSEGEMRNAKKRMAEYACQAKTIANPNLLSEMLRKEYDGHSIRFMEKLPRADDFPLYIFHRIKGKFERFNDIGKLEMFYPVTDPEMYWTRVFFGD